MKYVQWLTFADSFEFSKDIMFSSYSHVVTLVNSVMVDIILESILDTIAIWSVGWSSEPSKELTVVSIDIRRSELEELKKFSSSL